MARNFDLKKYFRGFVKESPVKPAKPKKVKHASVLNIIIENPDQEIPPLLYWCEPKHILRIHLPTELLCMQGAFAYQGGWHPFVQALNEGPEILQWFYESFQPTNITQLYFLKAMEQPGALLPPWELPWISRLERTPPPGECGLSAEHGISYFGPATAQKVQLEYERLKTTLESIQTNGYQPDEHGDIEGHFLRMGDEYRFFVRGGKHRAAALAYRGDKHIPVVMRPSWPRLIDFSTACEWPLVHNGTLNQGLAEEIFSRYFQFNGIQQVNYMKNKMVPERI